jgi:hypothetical protein
MALFNHVIMRQRTAVRQYLNPARDTAGDDDPSSARRSSGARDILGLTPVVPRTTT